jgi:hypothetical protein
MIHVLIDFESIQPRHPETWSDEDTHVTVFVGAHQEPPHSTSPPRCRRSAGGRET